jgi:hypothetical protein
MDNAGNSIDAATDTTGSTIPDYEQTSLGSIDQAADKCASIATTGSVSIDIVLHGYPPSDPLVGYDVTLHYDPSLVRVGGTIFDTFTGDLGTAIPSLRTLISADPQSGPFFAIVDPLPDVDGTFAMSVLDLAPMSTDEDVDGEEESDGFLARIKLEALGATGTSDLTLSTDTFFVIDDFGEVPIDAIQLAKVAVGEDCPLPFALDSDDDAFINGVEAFIGTDPLDACPDNLNDDAWPSDMDNNKTADLLDVLVYKPAANTNAGDANYKPRVDLDANGTVNLLDLLKFKQDFNKSCS